MGRSHTKRHVFLYKASELHTSKIGLRLTNALEVYCTEEEHILILEAAKRYLAAAAICNTTKP